MKRKFATWWQALLLFVVGAAIAFASFASALSGMGGGGQHLPENLLIAGFLIGATMAVTGIVLGIVVFILAMVRAFSSKPEPADGTLAPTDADALISQVAVTRKPVDSEQSILWCLRIAIIISMIVSATDFWIAFLAMNHRFGGSRYFEYLLVSYVLSEVPYVVALVLTARRADRVGVSTPLAASIFYLALWGWSAYRYLRLYSVVVRWALTLILDVLVLVFAWQASRIHPLDEKEKELVGAVFFAVGVYVIALHFGLMHAQRMFLR